MIPSWLFNSVGGNTIFSYLSRLFIAIGGIAIIWVAKRFGLDQLQKWAEKTETKFDDLLISLVNKLAVPLLYFWTFYLAATSLALNPSLSKAIHSLGILLMTVLGIRGIVTVLKYFVFDVYLKNQLGHAGLTHQYKTMMTVVSTVIWGMGLVFLLDNLGFNISAVLAGPCALC
ncbi:MAG: hypothetical protein LHV69_10650 [Elusimicrobia bacterium]|nr:hypothetical protein [Candidatus Obscuribacterium magneticum]